MPARCCAASGRGARGPARATPTRTASWCAPIRCCSCSARWTRAARSASFAGAEWDGAPLDPARTFVTGIGAGTTYPDYKPAPFIVSAEHAGVDTVTVVTEGIFSYCGVKVKIDTDRHLGPETAADPRQGRAGGARDHRRIRLADALHRRRAPPDRRLQEGGQRHLRCPARAVRGRGGGDEHRRRPHRDRRGRQGAHRRRPRRGAHAGGLRLGHGRHLRAAVAGPCRRGDRGRRPHHRRADRAPVGPRAGYAARPASACAGASPRPAATSRSPIRASAGAAPTSPSRCRSSRRSTRRWRGPACGC